MTGSSSATDPGPVLIRLVSNSARASSGVYADQGLPSTAARSTAAMRSP